MAVRRDRRAAHAPAWPRRPGAKRGGAVGAPALVVDRLAVEQQPRVLRDETDRTDEVAGGQAAGIVAPDADRAPRRAPRTRQHVEQRGLARTVAAHQHRALAGADLEVDRLQRHDGPVVEPEPAQPTRPPPAGAALPSADAAGCRGAMRAREVGRPAARRRARSAGAGPTRRTGRARPAAAPPAPRA